MQINANKNELSEKIILFGYAGDYALSELIRENMIHSLANDNFSIIDIAYPTKFKYKNLRQKLTNFFRKTFLHDKNYKLKLKFSLYEKRLLDKINSLSEKADFTFLIRPDLYPESFIKLLREKSKQFIIYQWNGISRFPLAYPAKRYFDKIFVFDPKDKAADKNVFFTTNFYFDLPRFLHRSDIQKNELYYLATFDKNRKEETDFFLRSIKNLPIEKNIIIRNAKFKESYFDQTGIRYTAEVIPYEENIHMAESAKILLEIVNLKYHQGLSLRVFEALCFDKKLITNNASIKQYDFYKKENIFIIGKDDASQLETFINSPYTMPDDNIKVKYSFSNWIRNILNLSPYIPIDLPAVN